jgi:exonuclease SbcC
MKIVEFQEIYMENFGPYITPMGYKFEKNKLTLITGPNGVGKTMSLEAIPYTLYGVTSKRAQGSDVINNQIGKNCKTWIKFTINTTDQYTVTRYYKYSKLGNTVILNKNGIDIKKGHREVLSEIEKIICPQKVFMNTIFFGQKVKDFFTDLVDSDKKEIFTKILGIEQYKLYYTEIDNELKDIQNNYNNLINKIELISSLLEDTTQQIKFMIESKKLFNKNQKIELNKIQLEIDNCKKEIEIVKEKKSELNLHDLNIDSINKEIVKIDSLLENITEKYKLQFSELKQKTQLKITEIKNIANENEIKIKNKNIKRINELNNKILELTNQNNINNNFYKEKIHEFELKKSKLYNDINSLKEKINEIDNTVIENEISTCPTCGQDIDETIKEKFIENLNKNKKQINSLTQTINEYENEIKKLKKELINKLQNINDELNIYKDEIAKLNNEEKIEIDKNKKKLNETLAQIKKILINESENIEKELHKETEKLKNDKNNFILKRNEIEENIKNINQIEKTLEKLNYNNKLLIEKFNMVKEKKYDDSQLISYENKKIELTKSLSEKKQELNTYEKNIKILTFWKSAFSPSGIPSMLIDEAIPFMNKRVSEYLDKITNGRYIVSFDTLNQTKSGTFKDKISVNVIDTLTQANSRIQLSGGQTRIIDIAIILTLGDLQSLINNVKFNLLLFDEIFDALDYDNIGYVSQTLNKLKTDKTIFVISHQHQDQLEPDETLTLN